jgi:hypothetical protein
MRIEHFLMDELDQLSIYEKFMAMLTDVQEIAKKIVEKKSNILENFSIPFKTTIEEYFTKEGKEIAEQNPGFVALFQTVQIQELIVSYSLSDAKTTRKQAYIKEAMEEYKTLVENKVNSAKPKKENTNNSLEGFIENESINAKMKDMVEFIYIYRYNQRETEKVLEFLNKVYQKKWGDNFLQNNMEIYQAVEVEVENLTNIEDKVKRLEDLIKEKQIHTVTFYCTFYGIYALGDYVNLFNFVANIGIPTLFREYLIELVLKRCEIKSDRDKIIKTINKTKEILKEIIIKLNSQEIPVVSKGLFEKMLIAGMKYFPNYFENKVVNRIRNNVYNYIKLEKIKNA